MYHHVFMYDGRCKTNSQINSSIKYISNTHGGVMQNKLYYNEIIIYLYFRVGEYLIDEGGMGYVVIIISYKLLY